MSFFLREQMTKDLRYFLKEVEDKQPNDFVRIKKEVDPKFELCGVIRKFQDDGRYPLVYFEKVRGSKFPVVSNLFASKSRLALGFGVNESTLVKDYMANEDKKIPSKMSSDGPVKENIIKGDNLDLGFLPHITHNEKDAGPYITSGVSVFKDPDTGAYDTGIFRLMYKGKNKFGVLYGDYSKAMHVIRKFESKGKPTEMAFFIGHHPASTLTSQTKVPLGMDEFSVMGGLLGEPVDLVQCETVDLHVPAFAEIVIEGHVLAEVREPEAPFGEYTWYYGLERMSHVLEVTAVTHRNNAIYHDIFSAHADHNMAAKVQREAVVYKRIKLAVPSIKDVELPLSGTCRHIAYVSIKKDYDGLGKIASLSALSADPMIKIAIIVDDDINVHNEQEVMWAVATRVQADRALTIVPEAYVAELDPSAYSIRSRADRGSLNTKWAIDATKPIDQPFQESADVPKQYWKSIDISNYL
ncbi:MAG: UbiD family decarboxylase [Thaumarchaeota archaeon]|nr:UbiD family decarboxylase [Nitrososphaerota archaeon]